MIGEAVRANVIPISDDWEHTAFLRNAAEMRALRLSMFPDAAGSTDLAVNPRDSENVVAIFGRARGLRL